MRRLLISVIVAALALCSAAQSKPSPAAHGTDDLFTIGSVKIDASGRSPAAASDLALAQGRQLAWSKLFRRLTMQAEWASEPQLADGQLLALVRAVDIANERRSTTRYVADAIFHFNPVAVRKLLRKSSLAFTETRSEPALVIPLTAGKSGFDPASPWASAWSDPSLQQSLVPMVPSKGETTDLFTPALLAQLDWTELEPIVRRCNAGQLILAIASEDARSVQMIEVSAAGRTSSSFAFARSTFAADVEAIAEQAANEWKQYLAHPKATVAPNPDAVVDDGSRASLTTAVGFDTIGEWESLRARLGAVKALVEIDVVGLARHEAQIELTYFGQMDQLERALAQQNLELDNKDGAYTLELLTTTAANSP